MARGNMFSLAFLAAEINQLRQLRNEKVHINEQIAIK